MIHFGSSSFFFFVCSYLLDCLVFFERNIFILCPAQTKLRILCRIVKLKGVSTDNDDTSHKQFFSKLFNIATNFCNSVEFDAVYCFTS